MQDLEWVGSFD